MCYDTLTKIWFVGNIDFVLKNMLDIVEKLRYTENGG